MARTQTNWLVINGGTAIRPNSTTGYDILVYGTDRYLNFNTVAGVSGYGFRDNEGVMEFKNSGGEWTPVGSGGGGGSGWELTGNAGTTAGTNFIGTTDAVDFVAKCNNIEAFRLLSAASSTNMLMQVAGSGDFTLLDSTSNTIFQAVVGGALSFIRGGGATQLDITTATIDLVPDTAVRIGSSKPLRFMNGSNYVAFQPGTLSGSTTWTLPTTDSTGTQALVSNGSGVLSWAAIGGGAVDSVNGQTGVVVLDADDIDDTSTTNKFVTSTDITNLGNLSGTNSGDQTSIVGITGTKAEFNTELSDGDFVFVGEDITLSENTSIILDPALSADGRYTGITRTGTAGAALAFGDLCYLDPTDSRWELVDANSAAGADGDARGVIAMCVLAAASDGDPTTLLLYGTVRADTAFPAMTVNSQMYVSETAGDITGTMPTTSGVVIRVVGQALTADELLFNPSPDYITHV